MSSNLSEKNWLNAENVKISRFSASTTHKHRSSFRTEQEPTFTASSEKLHQVAND
jgi:hypothetical protein